MDCKVAGACPGADDEPPPQPTISAATAARHTRASRIGNFFMKCPLVAMDHKHANLLQGETN